GRDDADDLHGRFFPGRGIPLRRGRGLLVLLLLVRIGHGRSLPAFGGHRGGSPPGIPPRVPRSHRTGPGGLSRPWAMLLWAFPAPSARSEWASRPEQTDADRHGSRTRALRRLGERDRASPRHGEIAREPLPDLPPAAPGQNHPHGE